MISVTAATRAALRGPHSVRVVVDAYRDGVLIASDIPVNGGEVRADRTANIRRTATIRIPDRGFIPTSIASPFAPYGQEFIIRYGVLPVGSTTTEWVQLGVFVVRSVKWDEPTGLLTVEGSDRTSRLIEAFGLPTAWVYYNNTNPTLAANLLLGTVDLRAFIDLLITHRAGPGVSVIYDPDLPTVAARSPKGLIATDRWETGIVAAARLLRGEVYCDHEGNFRIDVPPQVTDPPVWTVAAGEGGVLVSARRGLSRERVANMVTVQSQSTATSAWTTVYDNDPASPTYPGAYQTLAGRAADVTSGAYTGDQRPYGEQQVVVTSAVSTTTDDCEHEARIYLHNQLGLLRSVDFSAVPNPTVVPGDVVTINYGHGATERHLIDSLVIPLGIGGSWSAATRTNTYQLAA